MVVTFVLLIGLGLRLILRLSDRYLPFRLGDRLSERGEIVRRGLDGDRETGDTGVSDRDRLRPRSGLADLEVMVADEGCV